MFVTLPSDISSMVMDELVEDKVVLEPHHLNTELSLLSGQDSHKTHGSLQLMEAALLASLTFLVLKGDTFWQVVGSAW